MSLIYYVCIGNSDGKLTQEEWSQYCRDLRSVLGRESRQVHGAWYSPSDDPWVNMCMCVEFSTAEIVSDVRKLLGKLRDNYRQKAIAFDRATQEWVTT